MNKTTVALNQKPIRTACLRPSNLLTFYRVKERQKGKTKVTVFPLSTIF